MDKPEALRLANELDAYHTRSCHKEAAAELRRQHGEIKSMQAERLRSERRLLDVKAQRDALLEALEEVVPLLEEVLEITDDPEFGSIGHKARAAIAAVEEGK